MMKDAIQVQSGDEENVDSNETDIFDKHDSFSLKEKIKQMTKKRVQISNFSFLGLRIA